MKCVVTARRAPQKYSKKAAKWCIDSHLCTETVQVWWRRMRGAGRNFAFIAGVAVASSASWAAPDKVAPLDASLSAIRGCEQLMKEDFTRLPGAPTALLSAEPVDDAGSLPAYCEVKGYVQPAIQFTVRLPTKGWNGRYFQAGCGGFCGIVRIDDCNDVLPSGFVTAAHNMGHVGHPIKDPVWGSSPALREDYAGRSSHLVSLVAKAIAERFYGSKPAKSYFRGCSTGGREGLTLAQHYPQDFDGIIAGDPAFAGRLGAIANNWDAQQLLDDEGREVFDRQALQLLNKAVLDECDALDGLRDGILMDPRACGFDPERLRCQQGAPAAAACLSERQVQAAKNLYSGPVNSQGEALMPGAAPYGSELSWSGRGRRSLAEGYLRYLAFQKNPPADYNYRDFDFDTDIAKVEASARQFDPVAPYQAPDLRAFASRGGKLIVYHGWADAGVSPVAQLDYYAQVTQRQGGIAEVRQWFRQFMIPGMFHCRGGNAPNTFDFVPHIIRWVEEEQAPQRVLATQYEGEKRVRTRPVFPYPDFAAYKGKGDPDDAANWTAKTPDVMPDDRQSWLWAPVEDQAVYE